MSKKAQLYLTFLQAASQQGTLAHAYVLSGNDEQGKQEFAQSLLTALQCHKGDTMRIDPQEQEITIGQVRELTRFLSLGSWYAPYKVGIIQKAHTMNKEAQSALLKTLEEPTGQTLLLLVVDHKEMLLDTIRSRTQDISLYVYNQKTDNSFAQLQQTSLHDRFALAKKLATSPEQATQTLQELLGSARTQMLQKANNTQQAPILAKSATTIQETIQQLQYTTSNAQLSLERMMLSI
jgi:DNA polymerase III delta prime subunit